MTDGRPRLIFKINVPDGVDRDEWLSQFARDCAREAAIRANRYKSERGIAGWQVGR